MARLYDDARHEYRVDYQDGRYDQFQLPLRKRLRDEDVGTFLLWWLQGRVPTWIGRQLMAQAGGPIGHRMVRSHALRLAEQGILDERWGKEQPDWRAVRAEAEGRPVAVSVTGRRPMPYRGTDALPRGLRPQRGGRPVGIARRGRPPSVADTVTAADMMRGIAPPATNDDGPLVVPFYQASAKPPDGWQGTTGATHHEGETTDDQATAGGGEGGQPRAPESAPEARADDQRTRAVGDDPQQTRPGGHDIAQGPDGPAPQRRHRARKKRGQRADGGADAS